MAFLVSPGIQVREFDLTTVVPAVSTTVGAFAGVFQWGPVGERVLISDQNELVDRFGKPSDTNFETFFTAANFLAYGNALYVVRALDTTGADSAFNAMANTGVVANTLVKNEEHYDSLTFADTDLLYLAKYPGALGNSLRISVCDTANAYSNTYAAVDTDTTLSLAVSAGSNVATMTIANDVDGFTTANAEGTAILGALNSDDVLRLGNTTIGEQYIKISSLGDLTRTGTSNTYTLTINLSERISLSSDVADSTVRRFWGHYNLFDQPPGTSAYVEDRNGGKDEMHIAIIDKDGDITGTPETVLETWTGLSRATDAKTEDGSSNYYKTVLNNRSKWVWFANDRSGAASAVASSVATSTNNDPLYLDFAGGTGEGDESTVAIGDLTSAYDLYKDPEDVDISILLQGKARGIFNGAQLGRYLIENICHKRLDCVACISPARADVVNNAGDEARDIVTFRNDLRSTSYGILDSGYKYQYDKYNDTFRYVPLNGDIGGLLVYTDSVREAWYSPAGFNRGQIKNIIKLAYNPDQTDRDLLYRNGVNPVTNFKNNGIVLFGDKTLLAKPSAFDRINVRRLFIVLEKAIATAAKFTLFELNDEFTRAQFVSLVEPYLRTVQGRRGIYDFRVVCDETNNTAEIIDRNEFVGDIYIKPARAINFIRLNFVAVRTGVEFEEIVGKFGG